MMRPYQPASGYTRRQFRAQSTLLRLAAGAAVAALVAAALLASDLASAQTTQAVARFDGGIGVQPATWAGATAAAPTGGAAAANDVSPCPPAGTAGTPQCQNTGPAGRPWVISDLKAQVNSDGSFDVRGKGLLLAGTANVGRNGGASVVMRLYCGTGAAAVSFTSTTPVPLEANGDFRLTGELPGVVNTPLDCPNPVLLILNAGNKGWFAAGIPKN